MRLSFVRSMGLVCQAVNTGITWSVIAHIALCRSRRGLIAKPKWVRDSVPMHCMTLWREPVAEVEDRAPVLLAQYCRIVLSCPGVATVPIKRIRPSLVPAQSA